MKITDLIRTLRFIGWENPYRALLYSFLRDRQDRKQRRSRPAAQAEWQVPGDLMSAHASAHGAEFAFQHANLEILHLDQEVLRVSWQPGEPPVPYAIADQYWPGAATSLKQTDDGWVVEAGDLLTKVSNQGALSWEQQGQVTHIENPPEHNGEAWRMASALPGRFAVFGLGGRTRGLNLHGGAYRLWNRDPGGSYGRGDDPLYLTVPALLIAQDTSTSMIFYENSYPGEVVIDDQIEVSFEAGMLRYYLIFGDPGSIFRRYTQLTGKPELPPRWALGLHQSRWGYRDEHDIRAVLEGYRQLDLPLSAIHLDIDYMDGYRVFTTNPQRFPSLSDLSEEAHKQGVKLVSIIDPGVKIDRGFRLYREGVQVGAFCTLGEERIARAPVWPGWVAFPDFTDPDARRWWRDQYPRLLKQGISGIWHDMNEPAAFAAWGDATMPISTEHALEGKGGTHKQAHNLYGLLMNRAGLEALKTYQPDRRPFILSRSGWAGNQRFAWNWTGDVESSWEGLRVSLNLMLGMSLSGIFFTGSDIGGFSGDPSPRLMLRWMQLGVFTPFFRIHSALTSPHREPWRFEAPYREAMRQAVLLRYRLLPYLYNLAQRSSEQGTPLMRPFFWIDPRNPAYWEIDDQFFLGRDLLVAPLLEHGLDARKVTLPRGRWYSFWDHSRYEGPAQLEVESSLESIPVLVRGGAILPLEGQTLELHLYPGIAHSSEEEIYTDAGDGYGPKRIDTFTLRQSDRGFELEWTGRGEFPFPYDEIEIHLHGSDAKSVFVDGSELTDPSLPLRTKQFSKLRLEI